MKKSTGFKEIKPNKKSITQRGLVFGIGINDADYITKQIINGKEVRCPYYRRWVNMLKRCYSTSSKKDIRAYDGCTVCDEWLTFSNFKDWMAKHDWDGKELDKDIARYGNKVYSPETCIFVSADINRLLTDRRSRRGIYPQGVSRYRNGKSFFAGCSIDGKRVHIGTFDTEKEASDAYLTFKANHIYNVALKESEPVKSCLIKISKSMGSLL